MRTPNAYELVQVWEWGEKKHPLDRALGLLSMAYPELDAASLATLTVGQRNGRLLALRARTLGSKMDAYVECAACGEQLEFTVEVGDLLLDEPTEHEFPLTMDDVILHCRLPTSADLASIVGLEDAQAARHLLAQHCLLSAERKGQTLDYQDTPDNWLVALADAVTTYDPQAEMYFNLTCPGCGRSWSVLFDVVSFFWAELENRVKRLLYDVDSLARAYGWREADILSMSATRRQFYLDIVGG